MTVTVSEIEPAGAGDYTSLSAWEAAINGDHVTGTTQHTARYIGDWSGGPDSTALLVQGSVNDATWFMQVEADSSNTVTGTWDTSRAIFSGTCTVRDSFFYLVGVQISNQVYIREPDCKILQCHINTAASPAVRLEDPVLMVNTVLTGRAIDFQGSGLTTCYNCTVRGENTAVNAYEITSVTSGTMLCINCIAQDTTGSCFDAGTSSFDGSSDYNLADDTTPPGTNSYQSETVTFTTTDSCIIDASDASSAKFGGTDLSASGVTTDIIGTPRPTNPTVGAYEFPAAGGGVPISAAWRRVTRNANLRR